MALRPFDLTQSQFMLLVALVEMKSKGIKATQIELANASMVDVVSTSNLLKALESRGLVLKDQGSRDKRMRYLEITAEGERLVSESLTAVQQFDAQFFEPVTKNQLDAFLSVCRQLN